MAIYAVGDIQGCLEPLRRLLAKVNFDPRQDQLWSVGDVVNRGPASLPTLRFVKSLGAAFRMVLGNHDLHLLAVGRGHRRAHPKDTFGDILAAPDRDELLGWLQGQPLLIDAEGYVLVHAGIPPQWSLAEAKAHALEIAEVLRDERADAYFAALYGDAPNCWSDDLAPPARWRLITNYLTRMRFCDRAGRLELKAKLGPERAPAGFAPWYAHPQRQTRDDNIIFGHWATLLGRSCGARLFPTDTGCVWGRQLSLLQLGAERYVRVDCKPESGNTGAI